MNKLWLCGITNGPLESLKRLIEPSIKHFAGLCWAVDDKSPQEVIDYLNTNKKEGKIIVHPFRQAHDWQMNEWMHCGVIKFGDKCCIMDSTDYFAPYFLDNYYKYLQTWILKNVSNIFVDRPWWFTFTGHQYSSTTPHWNVNSLVGNTLQLSQPKENFILNGRDQNKNKSCIENPIKYFIEYKRSNATELLYRQFNDQIWQERERTRIDFQLYVEGELDFECTVNNLIKYISEGIQDKNLPDYVINYIESEVNMIDLVRYYILKQDLMSEIAVNRFNYSFKKLYYEGIEHQNKDDGYVGPFNIYKIVKGEKPE